MNWNAHYELEGKHAFLGASNYHWINYDVDKLKDVYVNFMAKERGTIIHKFASDCIKLRQRLPKSQKTLNLFVNDAIGYKMETEQILYFSPNAFGTADAICFRDGVLRVHDLKTGSNPAHFEQLMVYAALFCLEYNVKPYEISYELRLYQNNEVQIYVPESNEILDICNKIIEFDRIINNLKGQDYTV